MTDFGEKIRQIFIPFFIICISSTVIYTFSHWILFIKFNLFTVDEDVLNFWGPAVVPWIPVLIWLRPRIKLLNLKNKNGKGDPLFGYIMVAAFSIAAPIIIAQSYIISSTGKLTKLTRISQIDSLPKTKYYEVKGFYIDRQLARIKSAFKVSGRYNTDFNMYIYASVPMYDMDHTIKTYNYKISSPHSDISSNNALIVLNGKITTKEALADINPKSLQNIQVLKGAVATALYGSAAAAGVIILETKPYQGGDTLQVLHDDNMHYTPYAWIGVKYQKTISNHLSASEKEERYKSFFKQSLEDFKLKQLDNFIYLDRLDYSFDLRNYVQATELSQYPRLSTPAILKPVNEAFEARSGSEFEWIFGSMGIGSVIFLIALLFKPLRKDASSVDLEEQRTKDNTSLLVWLKALIIPQKRLLITQLLIEANLLIFIIMACAGLGFISFNAPDLLKLGANYRPAVDKGEYWRLLTSIFLHGGLMHVLMNMYGLFFVGLFLEPLMGRSKYLFTYLGCGIIASIASVWWHSATVSVGASGAIFGLFGAFLALLTLNFFPAASKKSLLINTSIFVGYNLLFGLTGGIDNAAHIGGLLSGLIFGYLLSPLLRNKVRHENANEDTNQFLDGLSNKPGEKQQEYRADHFAPNNVHG